jgi:hypothetical protein
VIRQGRHRSTKHKHNRLYFTPHCHEARSPHHRRASSAARQRPHITYCYTYITHEFLREPTIATQVDRGWHFAFVATLGSSRSSQGRRPFVSLSPHLPVRYPQLLPNTFLFHPALHNCASLCYISAELISKPWSSEWWGHVTMTNLSVLHMVHARASMVFV